MIIRPDNGQRTNTVREASFIADISVSAINRAIDERRIPMGIIQRNRTRLLTDWGVFILAVSKELKQQVPEEMQRVLVSGVVRLLRKKRRLAFSRLDKVSAERGPMKVVMQLKPIAERVEENRRRLERLMKTVVQDPEIQAGAPTFRGTRILVHPIAQALERGVSEAELLEDYPSLTPKMLEAARVYAETKPRRGRPRADFRGLAPLSERRIVG
ncbi:MAG TPA: DUF433 domain-containing protein [Stellaceae bacterium]|nr:DUF433 domain-containing protein [Stellaceae bacterium]